MTAPKIDDLEAVRIVVETLKDFTPEEQQRIFRWAAEKLGLALPTGSAPPTPPAGTPPGSPPGSPPGMPPSGIPAGPGAVDIKTFMAEKKPRNDVQYAAAVAYYYRFEAPPSEKKEAIDSQALQDATRKSGRGRFSDPNKTLHNAQSLGLLDRGHERGTYVINTVGENLVAMALPDGGTAKKFVKKKAIKKVTKKRARA